MTKDRFAYGARNKDKNVADATNQSIVHRPLSIVLAPYSKIKMYDY